jgi:hypothetical protein
VDGDHGGDLDVGDAEDLVGLVGLPPYFPERGDQQAPAMPQQPVGVEAEPSSVLLAVNHGYAAGADHQVVDVGLGSGDGEIVQHRPAVALQGGQQAGGAPLADGAPPPGQRVDLDLEPQPPGQDSCNDKQNDVVPPPNTIPSTSWPGAASISGDSPGRPSWTRCTPTTR